LEGKDKVDKMKWTKKITRILAAFLLVCLGLLLLVALTIAVLFKIVDKTNGSIESSGLERTYLLYVPPSYDPSVPVPLVISLHGFVEWPAHQMQISGWNDLADDLGFIVVYPSGTRFPRRWQAGSHIETADDLIQDVLFISDLIDQLEQDYNIDPSRIYANGLSNGGGMAYLLGCALSDRITAVGGVAGAYAFPLEDCHPNRPVPMIAFHGTADPIVPYLGGPSGDGRFVFSPLPDWIADRAALNGCALSPLEIPSSGAVSGIRYTDCRQGADVILYSIDGGGHSWPGGLPLPVWIAGTTSQEINATRVMWEFFNQYSIRE
jgi:polyhydroxybutyrate depolymerase